MPFVIIVVAFAAMIPLKPLLGPTTVFVMLPMLWSTIEYLALTNRALKAELLQVAVDFYPGTVTVSRETKSTESLDLGTSVPRETELLAT